MLKLMNCPHCRKQVYIRFEDSGMGLVPQHGGKHSKCPIIGQYLAYKDPETWRAEQRAEEAKRIALFQQEARKLREQQEAADAERLRHNAEMERLGLLHKVKGVDGLTAEERRRRDNSPERVRAMGHLAMLGLLAGSGLGVPRSSSGSRLGRKWPRPR